ncbi:MAG: HEAT repeat domain-containing protein [Ignavibacteriaceae bacterium]
MDLNKLLNDKGIKPKEKTETISNWILDDPKMIDNLISFSTNAKDAVKATCIEAIEFATKSNPSVSNLACFHFVTQTLKDKAPRIKWESAKVIGNIAHLYNDNLDKAVNNLLENSEHSGTVVRWSAAFALGEIVKLKTKLNKNLIPAIEKIVNREEKNSIKNIYLMALKKVKS